jgi:hypothetical protein
MRPFLSFVFSSRPLHYEKWYRHRLHIPANIDLPEIESIYRHSVRVTLDSQPQFACLIRLSADPRDLSAGTYWLA